MTVLVLYGTTEGQTRTIAAFIADRLRAGGRAVTLVDGAAQDLRPCRPPFDAAIVAASLHRGRYQPAVVDLVRRLATALDAVPNAFVSVSLSAAGDDRADWTGLTRCVALFERQTGWRPQEVHHAAGAFRFSRYGLPTRWLMRYVAWRKGAAARGDRELTDWPALGGFVDRFVARVGV